MISKTCSMCEEDLPLDAFHKAPHSKLGVHTYCKPCRSEYRKKNYDPLAVKRHGLKAKYGITLEQYDEMFEAQGGTCLICGNEGGERDLAVDHSHETGEVRGLLCLNCNAGIGNLRDDIELLKKAIKYLERNN